MYFLFLFLMSFESSEQLVPTEALLQMELYWQYFFLIIVFILIDRTALYDTRQKASAHQISERLKAHNNWSTKSTDWSHIKHTIPSFDTKMKRASDSLTGVNKLGPKTSDNSTSTGSHMKRTKRDGCRPKHLRRGASHASSAQEVRLFFFTIV